MFILTGETMCPKRHSKYNNTSGINRKTAFGNTHLHNIQYFSIIETIAFNTDFNIAIQLNINILTNPILIHHFLHICHILIFR